MIKATLTQPPVNTEPPRFPFLVIERKTNAIWVTIDITRTPNSDKDGYSYGLSPIEGDIRMLVSQDALLSGVGDFRLPAPGEKITIEY